MANVLRLPTDREFGIPWSYELIKGVDAGFGADARQVCDELHKWHPTIKQRHLSLKNGTTFPRKDSKADYSSALNVNVTDARRQYKSCFAKRSEPVQTWLRFRTLGPLRKLHVLHGLHTPLIYITYCLQNQDHHLHAAFNAKLRNFLIARDVHKRFLHTATLPEQFLEIWPSLSKSLENQVNDVSEYWDSQPLTTIFDAAIVAAQVNTSLELGFVNGAVMYSHCGLHSRSNRSTNYSQASGRIKKEVEKCLPSGTPDPNRYQKLKNQRPFLYDLPDP